MSNQPDQTTELMRRIAGQYIKDADMVEMAVSDAGSFLAAFGAFVDFQGLNSPSGFRALGHFFMLWKDSRDNTTKKKVEKSRATIAKLDADLDAKVTCAECEQEKPKVETKKHGRRVVCFSCRPLFAVK